jgi:hypothetical protein
VRLKVFCPDDDLPAVASVTDVWNSANWFEREAFDMYGIVFEGHADLRRILTDYGFIGHPMRKDFPVSGHVEMRYDAEKKRVIYQPVTIEPREITCRASSAKTTTAACTEATMAEIKNYTLNFGPAAPGRARRAAPGARTRRRSHPARRPAHRSAAPRHREAGREQDLHPDAALHGPSRLRVDDVQRARLLPGDREAAGRRRCRACAVHPRHVLRD